MSKRAGLRSANHSSVFPGRQDAAQSVELLTMKQVAEQLQVCVRTVRRLIVQKGVPIVQVGRQIRVPAEHIKLLMTKKW